MSRRKITTLINQGEVFLNNKGVENYKTECKEKDLLYIKPL
ncbi:hypothetical protein IJU97_02120 [bacterium]|nr:hypothetical protein [bacterium]